MHRLVRSGLLQIGQRLLPDNLLRVLVRDARNMRLRLLAVEQRGGLLEGLPLRLDAVEVDEDDLEGDPADVDDVVFPGDGLCGVALVIVVTM